MLSGPSRRPATSSIRRSAKRLLDNIYASGGSVDPEAAYVAFRGREPEPDALLRRRGLLDVKGGVRRRAVVLRARSSTTPLHRSRRRMISVVSSALRGEDTRHTGCRMCGMQGSLSLLYGYALRLRQPGLTGA